MRHGRQLLQIIKRIRQERQLLRNNKTYHTRETTPKTIKFTRQGRQLLQTIKFIRQGRQLLKNNKTYQTREKTTTKQ